MTCRAAAPSSSSWRGAVGAAPSLSPEEAMTSSDRPGECRAARGPPGRPGRVAGHVGGPRRITANAGARSAQACAARTETPGRVGGRHPQRRYRDLPGDPGVRARPDQPVPRGVRQRLRQRGRRGRREGPGPRQPGTERPGSRPVLALPRPARPRQPRGLLRDGSAGHPGPALPSSRDCRARRCTRCSSG